MENNALTLFEEQQVRRVWHNNEWYFVINDVIQVLTDSANPRQYFQNLKRREPELAKGGVQIEHPLSVPTEGGSQRMNCANRQSLLRLIMSIPSPKAEPFKLWLAQVGEQHIQEIENPELGIERIRELYKAKGYDDKWIETRLKTIDIRKELTDEWQQRGIKEGQEYAILTAEIAKATFGLTPSEHKDLKNLSTQNLRDHMTGLELIFTMLGEEATRTVIVRDDAQGFNENHDAAIRGGTMASNARKGFEATENTPVVSNENFLNQIKDATKAIDS
ncbi:MAG: Bro-N domain-containing protein [Saprospiraceae bacterium]|nr:Bro-N domain-containing protein [Saprospiraceae bacterium]